MKRPRCDRLWQIDAAREGALSAAERSSLERHQRTCEHCTRALAVDARLQSLVRQMPERGPSDLELRRLRVRVLADAAIPPRPRVHPLRFSLALAAVVAALGFGAVRGRQAWLAAHPAASRSAPFAALVSPAGPAVWAQAREAGNERVRLEAGAIAVQVRKQAPGERFVVDLPDGELEVRGTTFEVEAREGRTVRVAVAEGIVALRVGGPEVVLRAGETWPSSRAPAAAAGVVPSAPVAAPAAPQASAPQASARAAQPRTPTPTRAFAVDLADYAAAMDLYRAAAYQDAAEAFHRFVLAHPDSDVIDDAAFLEASSLARAGRSDAASLVAERHAKRFPASFHRRDDLLIIARAARDRGDCPRALTLLAGASATDVEATAVRRACGATGAGR